MLETASELASRGIACFPCKPNSKIPAIKAWQKVATQDPLRLAEMFLEAERQLGGHCNYGMVMGRISGIIGADIDCNHGASPEFIHNLNPTWIVKSGNGYHAYFKYPKHWPDFGLVPVMRGNGKDGAPCISLRGNGHYFVGPTSIHPDTGLPYGWLNYTGFWNLEKPIDFCSPGEVALADPPEWLLQAVLAKSSKYEEAEKSDKKIYYENERHSMLLSTAVRMRKEGGEFQSIVDRLRIRNAKDCSPPKDNAEKEIENIARWATLTVAKEMIVQPAASHPTHATKTRTDKNEEQNFGEHITPLGVLDDKFYYISSRNKQITQLSDSGHRSTGLMRLQPLEYWQRLYGNDKGKVNWEKAGSDLMHACFDSGIFDTRRMRGAGAWVDKRNALILHVGDRLVTAQGELDLFGFDSRYTYRLTRSYDAPAEEVASQTEIQTFLDACSAGAWKNPQSAILLAGGLALSRICGALPWRPHLWLTGPAGSGKTSYVRNLCRKMAGDWGIFVEGDATAAGIRQELDCGSGAVIFDESETNDKRSGAKVAQIVALARPASSETEAYTLKGTPQGKALSYKVSSQFILSSIRVNLIEEADQTRFCVLELEKTSRRETQFEARLEAVTQEICDKIFAKIVGSYSKLIANFSLLRKLIAADTSPRHGDQYGMLLAGYWTLIGEELITEAQARELISSCGIVMRTVEAQDALDEEQCLDQVRHNKVRCALSELRGAEDVPLIQLIQQACDNALLRGKLQAFGLDAFKGYLAVANSHPELKKLYSETRWGESWKQALLRLPGAKRHKQRFLACNLHCVRIPLDVVFGPGGIEDDGVT